MPGHVDSWLRRALEPSPQIVQRVVDRALRAERPAGTGIWLPARGAVAAALLVPLGIGLLVLLRRDAGSPRVPTITNASGELLLILPTPVAAPERPDTRTPIIFNEGGVVAAIVPGGEPTFLLSGGDS